MARHSLGPYCDTAAQTPLRSTGDSERRTCSRTTESVGAEEPYSTEGVSEECGAAKARPSRVRRSRPGWVQGVYENGMGVDETRRRMCAGSDGETRTSLSVLDTKVLDTLADPHLRSILNPFSRGPHVGPSVEYKSPIWAKGSSRSLGE